MCSLSFDLSLTKTVLIYQRFKVLHIKSEFERSIIKETYDDCIYISTNNLQYFDFLDFLKEPEPIITITIPDGFILNVEQDGGTLQLSELNTKEFFPLLGISIGYPSTVYNRINELEFVEKFLLF